MENTFEMQIESNGSISNAAKRWEKLRRISKASIGLQIMLIVVIVCLSINAVYVQIKYAGISKEVVRVEAEQDSVNKEQIVKLRRDLKDVQTDVEKLDVFKVVVEREINTMHKAIEDLAANHSEVRKDLHEVIGKGNKMDRTVNAMFGEQEEMKENLTSDYTNRIGSIKQHFQDKIDDLNNRLTEGQNKMAPKSQLLQLNSKLSEHLSDYKYTVSQLKSAQKSSKNDINELRESTRRLNSTIRMEIEKVDQEIRQNTTNAVKKVKAVIESMRKNETAMNKRIEENQNSSNSLSERMKEAETYLKALLNSSNVNGTCEAVFVALSKNQTIDLLHKNITETCVYKVFTLEPKRIQYMLTVDPNDALESVQVDGKRIKKGENGKQRTSDTSILVISLTKNKAIKNLKLSYYAQ